jgi:hypothetical protein
MGAEVDQRTWTRAVVAVFLPREHLPFIRGWCEHHVAQGWSVVLYDNTGSVGSERKSSTFKTGRLQSSGRDKRGNNYAAYTAHLTDAEVQAATVDALAGIPVDLRLWQPRNGAGEIIHGQVEAYVDFIRRSRGTIDWAAFIDADEYLDHGAAFSWDELLSGLLAIDCYRALLQGQLYESRWTAAGDPRAVESLKCAGLQSEEGSVVAPKSLVRLDKVLTADIHWGWRLEGANTTCLIDALQFHFRHYRAERIALNLKPKVRPMPSPDTDESISI